MSRRTDDKAKKFVDLVFSDLRALSNETKRKFHPVKEVNYWILHDVSVYSNINIEGWRIRYHRGKRLDLKVYVVTRTGSLSRTKLFYRSVVRLDGLILLPVCVYSRQLRLVYND